MKKSDYILISALLITGIIFFVVYHAKKTPGLYAVVHKDGGVYASFPLNKDTSVRIPQTGDDYNIICIKDGYVTVSDTDCPDMICTEHAPISETGETIVCLPHQLSVTITGHAPR